MITQFAFVFEILRKFYILEKLIHISKYKGNISRYINVNFHYVIIHIQNNDIEH